MNTKTIRVGVQGCGYAARTFHLPHFQQLSEYQVVAVNSSRPDQVQAACPGALCLPGYEDLLALPDVDLVVITGPNSCHFSYTRAALQAGKHVLLEKPAVTSVAEGEELMHLAQRQGRVLTVYQNRRWDGDYLTIQALIREGVLGDLHLFESHFDRFRPTPQQRWRELPGIGTGIFWDLGPHLIDQAIELFGTPLAVQGQVKTMRTGGSTADYFHLCLDYDALQVILHSSPFCSTPNQRFRLEGSDGSYLQYGLDPQEDHLKAGRLPLTSGFGEYERHTCGQLFEIGDKPLLVQCKPGNYAQLYRDLAHCIQHGGPNPVSMESVLPSIGIMETLETCAR